VTDDLEELGPGGVRDPEGLSLCFISKLDRALPG
jgi:hypothetical protein